MLNPEGAATAPCLSCSDRLSLGSTGQACTSAGALSEGAPLPCRPAEGSMLPVAVLQLLCRATCGGHVTFAQLRCTRPCPADQRWADHASLGLDVHATAHHPDG